MVSMTSYGINGITYTGLSTDDKPTDAQNGNIFLEMDTGKIYFYNAAGSAWVEWGASS